MTTSVQTVLPKVIQKVQTAPEVSRFAGLDPAGAAARGSKKALKHTAETLFNIFTAAPETVYKKGSADAYVCLLPGGKKFLKNILYR